MKLIITYLLLTFLFSTAAFGQDNYHNKKFGLILTATNRNCLRKCAEIATQLHASLNSEFFDLYDNRNANWSKAFKENNISSTYPGMDFFLTSTIKKVANDIYEITFVLYDSKKSSYYSPSLKNVELSNEKLEDVSRKILDELEYFKDNAQFKKIILIDDFSFLAATPDDIIEPEDFSDWLAYEMREHKIIGVSYHVYYYKKFKREVANKIDGDFKKSEDMLRVKIKIQLLDKRKNCKPLLIDIDDYENINKDDILNEILDKIKFIESDN